ncbi:MAG: LAGLIDADG family homing endonuclease [Deltaproteobacteria bacterium]|nr:LAGLIDADG family homing endonuclease [Deltaproteobacteria bacterium]
MPIKKLVDGKFFDIWTPESAYILGLLMADGTLTTNPRGSRYVEFLSTDRELVDLFRALLNSNHKISLKKRKLSPKQWKPAYRIQIGNQHMLTRLDQLGLDEKTIVPRIPKPYYRDFVRGFFDGDGCVVSSSYFSKERKHKRDYLQVVLTSKHHGFLKQLHSKLRVIAKLKGGSLYKGGRAYRLRYSQRDVLGLFVFLYKGTEKRLSLSRKYRIFEKAFEKWSAVCAGT